MMAEFLARMFIYMGGYLLGKQISDSYLSGWTTACLVDILVMILLAKKY
jgi:hypothetical protein